MRWGDFMLFETILALFAAAGTLFVVCFIVGRLLHPVGMNGLAVYSVIVASGSAPELQQTVEAVCELSKRSAGKVLMPDGGMDPETRRCAEILSRTRDIPLLTADEAAACLQKRSCIEAFI
jgi:hypothetical protein